MTNDIEQEKRQLKKKIEVCLLIVVAGTLTTLLYESGSLIGLAIIAVGALGSIPAIRRLRRIGTPLSLSERKRRLWPQFGVLVLTFLFWGIFYSRRTPHTQLVLLWGLFTVLFLGLAIWCWYISKFWTK